MDALITAAARSLSTGDPLGALKRVALREDAPALALRDIAMAQLGELGAAKGLLRRGARAFGTREPVARARCLLAEAEVALVLRELGEPMRALDEAQATLEEHGDRINAAHAGYLKARWLLLIGRLDEAQTVLERLVPDTLPPASRAGAWLVAAGIAIRRIKARPASAALGHARQTGITALVVEVENAIRAFKAPAGRLLVNGKQRTLGLDEVEALFASDMLIVDASRNCIRAGGAIVSLNSRPVLFALARLLGEAWPDDVTREALVRRAFRAREVDESYRARLRVEIGRLRSKLGTLADIRATERGFVLRRSGAHEVAVLAPPQEHEHGDIMALLADGEAWASSALALALNVSPRTVQMALDTLAAAGKVDSLGRGRASRWMARQVPGFPTSLLLPAPLPAG